jgi:hypothetical protein
MRRQAWLQDTLTEIAQLEGHLGLLTEEARVAFYGEDDLEPHAQLDALYQAQAGLAGGVRMSETTMPATDEFWAKLRRRAQRNCDQYKALSTMTGLTIADFEADLTIPNPHITENSQDEAVQ